MSAKLKNAFGRTWHEIQLVLYTQSPKQIPFAVGSVEHRGFMAQQETLYKNTVKRIFRPSATAPLFNVNKHAFTLTCTYGSLTIAGGILDRISLHTFPHNTTLTILSASNAHLQTFHNVGNPNFNP